MEKYSDKFLNNTYKLKNARIGFEFEFYMKDLSYYKTLEILNNELNPIKVWGFKQYHSNFKPDDKNFKIEPDLSGGSNMVELITGPLDYYNAKYFLVKIVKFIQNYGYTNEKSSIHFNVSFDNRNLNNLNVLKLILTLDEEEIYRTYPSRKNNVYAKSIKKLIPFKEYDFYNIPIDIVKNNLRFPSDKYYGVNLTHIIEDSNTQRLEFRYIGGKDYENNIGNLTYFMDKFIINTYDSIDSSFDSEDIYKLEEYLDTNISMFKNLSIYDNFIVDFPDISLQIDQKGDYDLVSGYYSNIYGELYNLVLNVNNLKDCILNYVTETQTLEIIGGNINSNGTLSEMDFIDCKIDGIIDSCNIVNCDINNSQLSKCTVYQSEILNSKVLNCKVETTKLDNCFFMDGYLNSDMFGGVFRSGELGPFATMDSKVKVINTEYDNFFNTKFDNAYDKPDKDSIKDIKNFKS